LTVAAGRLEVETPDHVVLRYDLAGAGNRGFAAVVDFLLAAIIAFTANVILSWAGAFNQASVLVLGGIALIVTLVLIWAYFILLEWLWNGQTIGKRAYRLRVINEDGSPAQFSAPSRSAWVTSPPGPMSSAPRARRSTGSRCGRSRRSATA
jgi:uncharacterized RDD family membrane protein YckC